MTDRVHSITVCLAKPMRTDDAQSLMNAIGTMRNVSSVIVTPENVADIVYHAAIDKARCEFRERLAAVLWPKDEK